MTSKHQQIIEKTRTWVETFVVGLNLCPFARRELVSERLHFSVSDAVTNEQLLMDLQAALEDILAKDEIETTLLIHPDVLQDFDEYNQFLDYADMLLRQMNLEGIYQVASFHPDYQFEDIQADDVRNYTNKSPFPMLHILAEASIEKAVASYRDADLIPENNQDLLVEMGREAIHKLLNK